MDKQSQADSYCNLGFHGLLNSMIMLEPLRHGLLTVVTVIQDVALALLRNIKLRAMCIQVMCNLEAAIQNGSLLPDRCVEIDAMRDHIPRVLTMQEIVV